MSEGPVRRFLRNREPILKRNKIIVSEDLANDVEPQKKKLENVEPTVEPSRPTSGKTYADQSDTAYCIECIEGHTMVALTEMRHAIDRCRSAGDEITQGVSEKVRVAIGELMGILEDARNTEDAPPDVKKELNEIQDEVRWIRKEYGVSGKGLTAGGGTMTDLEEARNRIFKLQTKAYALVENCPTCKRITKNLGEKL